MKLRQKFQPRPDTLIRISLAAVGMAWLVNGGKAIPYKTITPSRQNSIRWIRIVAAGIFSVTVISSLFWVRLGAETPQFNRINCPDAAKAIYVRLETGSYLKIIGDAEQLKTHFPILRIHDYEHSVNESEYRNIFSKEIIYPDSYFMSTINLSNGLTTWINFPAGNEDLSGMIIGLCAKKELGDDGLYWNAESVFPDLNLKQ